MNAPHEGTLFMPLAQRARDARSSAIREILKVTLRPEVISFAGGLPAPETFPVDPLRDAVELQCISADARDIIGLHRRDIFAVPRGLANDPDQGDANAGMSENRAPGRARQSARAPNRDRHGYHPRLQGGSSHPKTFDGTQD